MRTLVVLTNLFFLFSISQQSIAQNIYYYGPDTNHHYHPSDIIETQNGELVIMADVNLRGYILHNYFFDRYLLRIRTNGDTVWQASHADTRGQGMLLEQSTGAFVALNNIDGAYACGMVGQTLPYSDYGVNTYNNTGILTSSVSYDEVCDNRLSNFKKRDDGGILAVHKASDAFGSNSLYSIKELAPNGQLSSLPFPSAITGQGLIEKHATGYYILKYRDLYQLDLAGNVVRRDSIFNYPYLQSFIKVAQDSLLVVSSATHVSAADLTYLSKYNNVGQKDWTDTLAMETNHILWHPSGNYLLTGTRNDQLSLLLVSPNGDSLWGATHPLPHPTAAVKTIAISNNKIATVARERANYSELSGQIIVVVDSINLNATLNSITTLSPPLAAHCYPNPSSSQVQVDIQEAPHQQYQVSLTSLLGQRVLQETQSTPSFSIGVKQLPKGLYLLTITSSSGAVFKEKVVVGE